MITYKYNFNENGNIIMSAKPKMTKNFVLHLKKDILVDLIKRMKNDNYNHDIVYDFFMKIGRKPKNRLCRAFNIIYDNENNLEFYIKEVVDNEHQYQITIHNNYMIKLLEIVNDIENKESFKYSRTAIIEHAEIIKNFDKDITYAPNLTLINKFVLDAIKLKSESKLVRFKNIEYQTQNNENIVYNNIIIKIYNDYKISIKFKYLNEVFKILIDANTMKEWMKK